LTAYVIDASVASRFLLVEDLSDKAAQVLEGFLEGALDLSAPKLMICEVGNTLWKATKRGFISLDQAERKFSYLLRLKIDSIELNEEDHREVLKWSVRSNATYYDSLYVRSSIKVGAVLLTGDDTLFKVACEEIPAVHLRDYRR